MITGGRFKTYRIEVELIQMNWLKGLRSKQKKVCPICGEVQELNIVPLLRGSHGQVEVFFNNLPTLFCGRSDHPRRFADPDFGARLIDAVFWKKSISLAQQGTWARVKCHHCGKNLSKEPSEVGEVGGVLKITDLPSFSIRIQGPVIICPRCETEQLKATKEVSTDVSSAFVDAFQRIDLKP